MTGSGAALNNVSPLVLKATPLGDAGNDAPAPSEPAPPARRKRPAPRPNRTGRTLLVAGIVLAAIAGGIAGLRYGLPQEVPVFAVLRGDLPLTLSAPGTLSADTEVTLAPRLAGRLAERRVETGDAVTTGSVVARLDSDSLDAAVTSASAALEAARLATRAAAADAARANDVLIDAKATLDRQDALLASGTVARASRDAALTAYRQAVAAADSAKATASRTEALEASAAASLDLARLDRAEADIVAPFSGIVTATGADPGDVVGIGTAIATLVDPLSIVLDARLDESAISRLAVGQPAGIVFGDGTDAIPGNVIRLGRQVDAETREFGVTIAPDRLPENWAIGQRGTARIETSRLTDVLSIPSDLVVTRRGVHGVFVVENGRARWREISLGAIGGDAVAVLDGLADTDRVLAPAGVYAFMPVAGTGTGQ